MQCPGSASIILSLPGDMDFVQVDEGNRYRVGGGVRTHSQSIYKIKEKKLVRIFCVELVSPADCSYLWSEGQVFQICSVSFSYCSNPLCYNCWLLAPRKMPDQVKGFMSEGCSFVSAIDDYLSLSSIYDAIRSFPDAFALKNWCLVMIHCLFVFAHHLCSHSYILQCRSMQHACQHSLVLPRSDQIILDVKVLGHFLYTDMFLCARPVDILGTLLSLLRHLASLNILIVSIEFISLLSITLLTCYNLLAVFPRLCLWS